MLRPTLLKVSPDNDYNIIIEFDSGDTKKFDVKPYIQGSWYGQLKNVSYFYRVTTDGFTVCWPNGQNLCPDELYEMSVSV